MMSKRAMQNREDNFFVFLVFRHSRLSADDDNAKLFDFAVLNNTGAREFESW